VSFIITILVIIGLVYLFRLIWPYLLRYLINKLIRNLTPKDNFSQEKKEKKNNPSDKIGEYIDYEEID